MAADLDVVIRQLARQQHTALMAAAKKCRDAFTARAGAAKDPAAKQRFKHLAKQTMEHGAAAAKRLRVSADNAADSYARAMRKAVDTGSVPAPAAGKARKPSTS